MPKGKAKWKRLSRKKDSSGDALYESIDENGVAILRINSFTTKEIGDYECRAGIFNKLKLCEIGV